MRSKIETPTCNERRINANTDGPLCTVCGDPITNRIHDIYGDDGGPFHAACASGLEVQ